jgi:hypothetical protein
MLYIPSIGAGYIIIANLLANMSYIWLLRKEIFDYKFEFEWPLFKELLVYAYPIMIMGLAGMVNQVFDRILLEQFLPENFYPGRTSRQALGIYGNAYKLSILWLCRHKPSDMQPSLFSYQKIKIKTLLKLWLKLPNGLPSFVFLYGWAYVLTLTGSKSYSYARLFIKKAFQLCLYYFWQIYS